MQDGKALQAGTSHYLGTNFAEASGIRYQDQNGSLELCHTTSWGVSTRLIGAVIMTHGDDDGLRVPPTIAPRQVVILPMLRGKEEDAALIEYCEELRAGLATQSAFGERLRVLLDAKPGKTAGKRWDYVRKGVPVIIEIGGRDIENGVVSMLRRDALWAENGKPDFHTPAKADAIASIPALLEEIQAHMFTQARDRRDANITRDITAMAELPEHFDDSQKYAGWVEVQWSKRTSAALEAVVEDLKALKLTIRNVPIGAAPADGTCIFTGEPAVERIFVAKAY